MRREYQSATRVSRVRGGSPTAYDRVLATRFGTAALDAVHDAFLATGAPVLVEHHEPDFDLLVLGRPS